MPKALGKLQPACLRNVSCWKHCVCHQNLNTRTFSCLSTVAESQQSANLPSNVAGSWRADISSWAAREILRVHRAVKWSTQLDRCVCAFGACQGCQTDQWKWLVKCGMASAGNVKGARSTLARGCATGSAASACLARFYFERSQKWNRAAAPFLGPFWQPLFS